jgi:hypothetical protein
MRYFPGRHQELAALMLALAVTTLPPLPSLGQVPFGAPTTPQAQRNALGVVRSQVSWVQNATKVASSYGPQGNLTIWEAFQRLGQAYGAFKATLTPRQLAYGANELAELDAGLDLIQEAFANYEQDLATGHAVNPALRNLCRVVREGSVLWLQEFNKACTRLRVGLNG